VNATTTTTTTETENKQQSGQESEQEQQSEQQSKQQSTQQATTTSKMKRETHKVENNTNVSFFNSDFPSGWRFLFSLAVAFY